MKKGVILAASFVLIITMIANAKMYPDKGRNIWKKNCRLACHDGKKSGIPKLAPSSKTQLQWKNVFSNDRRYIYNSHKGVDFSHLSEKDWKAIEMFVTEHAYDTDQPESCETTENFVK